jgi:trehalose 6-phosphate synthase
MPRNSQSALSRSLRLGVLTAATIGLAAGLFAWRQVRSERAIDLDDVTRRAHALAQQISAQVVGALAEPDDVARERLEPRLAGYRRLLGYAVFRADGSLLAAGKAVAEVSERLSSVARAALVSGEQASEVTRWTGLRLHLLADPLAADGELAGVLVVVHDVSYIDERATARLIQYAFSVMIVMLLAMAVMIVSTWLAYERPLRQLADWMRRLRVENIAESPPPELPSPLLRSESDRLAASYRAARSSGRALSEATSRADQVWTAERLRAHALAALGANQQLIVVSNREPYMHQLRNGVPHMIVPAGGLVTALDPVLQACGGVWIAHGAGDADRETADAEGRLTVPPADSRYTLKRIWLSREEEQRYYYGFSNEGLWPLSHFVHERPTFRTEDWQHYQIVNRRFAEAVLAEIGTGGAVVLVQDYQLALVPRLLKSARPDLRVGLFWHIPWPHLESFRICPQGAEILDGMLGADLIGFHLQQYANSFLDTVDRVLESRLDWDHFAVDLRGGRTVVRPFPISVQPWSERHAPTGELLAQEIADLKAQHRLGDAYLAVGVDRIDYTKGLAERFRAVERFLEKYPQHRGRFTLVSLGAPSRTHIPRYREYLDHMEGLADEINWKYQTESWKPIRFLVAHHDARTVHAFLHMAPMCIVSSLHDGMNLVAKEYVAAQTRGDGVLVLSEFAGAAPELAGALIINPYDTERFADAIRAGIEMSSAERRARMQRLSRQVEDHNIYRWAAGFLSELTATRGAATHAATGTVATS